MLCGLLMGYLATVIWGLIRRKQRQVSARHFARELDRWIKEIDTEEAQQATVIGFDE
jgi:hypothetical protein